MPENGSLLYGRSFLSLLFFNASGVASQASEVERRTGV